MVYRDKRAIPSSVLLAVVPLALACATQIGTTAAVQREPSALTVQMLAPEGGAVRYRLSEPAYVAVFAITPGSGIGLVLPEAEAKTAEQRPAGLNRQVTAGRVRPLSPAASRGSERRSQWRLPIYYVVASRYPLPVEELRAAAASSGERLPTSMRDAAEAIADALTAGVPADAWDDDVYRYPANPSTSASRRGAGYPTCEERAFNRTTLIAILSCQTSF